MNEAKAQVVRVAREIERYLETRPDAADDIKGIRTWWIARQRFLEAHNVVEAALELLVTEGKVERLAGANNQVLYRRRDHG